MRVTVREVTWEEGREALLAVRAEVFVVEQRVPVELEDDGSDVGVLAGVGGRRGGASGGDGAFGGEWSGGAGWRCCGRCAGVGWGGC